MESKARGVQKAHRRSDPPCCGNACRNTSFWPVTARQSAVCAHGGVAGSCRRPFALPSVQTLLLAPGKKKNRRFEVCASSPHLLPWGGQLAMLWRWWQPEKSRHAVRFLTSKAVQWSSADGIAHEEAGPSSCLWVLGTQQGERRIWSELAAACCAVLPPGVFVCGLQRPLPLPRVAEEQSQTWPLEISGHPSDLCVLFPKTRILLCRRRDFLWRKDFLCQMPGH